MIHAAGNRAAADSDVGRIGGICGKQAGEIANVGISVHDQGRVIADGPGDRRQITKRLGKDALQRTDHDRR